MQLGILWGQASTQRGLIWVATALVGAVLLYQGKQNQGRGIAGSYRLVYIARRYNR